MLLFPSRFFNQVKAVTRSLAAASGCSCVSVQQLYTGVPLSFRSHCLPQANSHLIAWWKTAIRYLIELDAVMDLPEVLAATCSMAQLQQQLPYFMLSQFRGPTSILRRAAFHTLKHTNGGTHKRERGVNMK